jgi:endoglucanase
MTQMTLSRRKLLAGLAAGSLATWPHGAAAQGPEHQGWQGISLRRPQRGFNLPGVGDTSPGEAQAIEPRALSALRALGFDTIRLPVEPALLCADEAQSSLFLSGLDVAIEQLLLADFTVTLDMHPGPQSADLLRDHPNQGGDLVMRAWQKLLGLRSGWPGDSVALELLNEPALPSALWPDLRGRLAALIRGSGSSHTLVWGAANYQTIEETIADQGPEDDDAIVAVHYYYPMIFTHQGQDWVDGPLEAIQGFTFPSSASSPAVRVLKQHMEAQGRTDAVELIDKETEFEWAAARIAADMARLKDWALRIGRPVVINEFGVYRKGARVHDRAAWLKAVRASAENNGFGWAHWELDQGFGFMTDRTDPRSIEPEILEALLGRRL